MGQAPASHFSEITIGWLGFTENGWLEACFAAAKQHSIAHPLADWSFSCENYTLSEALSSFLSRFQLQVWNVGAIDSAYCRDQLKYLLVVIGQNRSSKLKLNVKCLSTGLSNRGIRPRLELGIKQKSTHIS
jgi:hypothetical protein